MKKPNLKVIIFVDAESDFYYHVPSPHFSQLDMIKWKINKLAGKLYRYPWPTSNGITNLINCFNKNDFKATFCITGHLFLKSCNGFPHLGEKKPKHPWYNGKIGNNWYYWDKGGSYKDLPGIYMGNIIAKEKDNPLFEFGLHGFAHEALTLESKETIDSIVAAGIEAASKHGIKINTFACPFEMTSDVRDPERVADVLRKYKIKRLFHAGSDDGLIIKRFFRIARPFRQRGLERIWISNYFEGTSSKKEVKKILKQILDNKDKKAVYCLGTHDFTHKNTKNLQMIIDFLKTNGFA